MLKLRESTDEAYCPHCNAEQVEKWRLSEIVPDLKHLTGTAEILCWNCKKDFTVRWSIAVFYITEVIEGSADGKKKA